MLASYSFNLRPQISSPFDAHLPNLQLLEGEVVFPERYAPVIMQEQGDARLRYQRWGLIPSWAQEGGMGRTRLTAPAHNIFQRPSFQFAIRKQRCLIPADSFELKPGLLRQGQRYRLARTDNSRFCFAGIYDCWQDNKGEWIYSFAIVSTEAPASLRPFSRQIPLVLPRHLERAWLNPDTNLTRIAQITQQVPADLLTIEPLPHEAAVASISVHPAAA